MAVRIAFAAAGALAAALAASSAFAQDYGRGETVSYRTAANEEVTITAPPRGPARSSIGAPIRDVALSSTVAYDDLDLRTRGGAHALRERIRHTARDLCRQLDTRYPITAEGSPPCYRTALADAMVQADAAIDDARNADVDDGYDDR